MKSTRQIVGLLKAIYFLAISIVMILLSYVFSDGRNIGPVLLLYAGIAFFFVGIFMGWANFIAPKDDSE